MMDIWEGVSEFVAVAELGSFTAAAGKLDISVAQVSRQVSRLEKRLSTQLLYRTTRKVSLSAEGEVYFERCKAVLADLKEAELALSDLKSTPQGSIKLTAPVMYGESFIMPLVHDFMIQNPAVEVRADLTNQPLDLIEGGYDLAIRLGKLKDSTLMAAPISSRSYRVCAAPEYFKHHGTPHVLSELSHHLCLVGQHSYWKFHLNRKEHTVKVQASLNCNSGHALVDAALKGLGLVQLPNYYVDDYIKTGQLVEALAHFAIPKETIWAVYPNNRHLSAKIRQLVDHLKAQLG